MKEPFIGFILAFIAACFAWIHGGWFALYFIFFFAPLYALWNLILFVVLWQRRRKQPGYTAPSRIRVPYVSLLVLLVVQNLLQPVLTDNVDSIGTWSLFTGFKQAAENSSAYNNAGLFVLLTNLAIIICFVICTVIVIKDRKRA